QEIKSIEQRHQGRFLVTIITKNQLYMLIKFYFNPKTKDVNAATNKFDPIINGKTANITAFPYFAFLSKNNRSLRCGGAIIKTNVILTAAHCLTTAELLVFTGVEHLDDLPNRQPHHVKKIIQYPEYRGQTRFDLGLVILSDHIQLGPTARLIDVAPVSPRIGSKVTIAGFGKVMCDTSSVDIGGRCRGGDSKVLRSATFRLASHSNRIIKTNGSNQNTCYGDSGSPVVHRNRVIGVVSSGEYINCSGYDTQAPTAPFYDWIQEHLKKY
ncbi:Trypsin, partial [Oryctes borbonicus]